MAIATTHVTAEPALEAERPVPLTKFEQKFGHPRGLAVLFGTEMGERLSYYGMRSLLVLYMTKYLFLDGRTEYVLGHAAIKHALESVFGPLGVQPLSSQIYGIYTGLVYLAPLGGGYLADRYFGQRKTVIGGSIIMAIGHFLMAFEHLFYIALLVIIVGNGGFKPNVSTQVGGLYAPKDPRRDRAYSIFYVGINMGSFFSPLVCGTLGQKVGWHYGFAAAGVAMCLSLALYLWGQKDLAPDNVMRQKAEKVKAPPKPFTQQEKAAIWSLVVLCLLNIVFWAVYEQQGNTMQLWADDQTNWPTIFGWTIPSTYFQSVNPIFIFTLTPLLTGLWARQAAKGTEPSSVIKMAIGCAVLGLSFLLMVAGVLVVGDGKGSVMWLVSTTLFTTMGELYLSPIGLSFVTKVAPARIVSLMMGMWFLSNCLGNYLCGYIGSFYSRMPKTSFFLLLTAMGVGAGMAILAVSRPIKRAVGENV